MPLNFKYAQCTGCQLCQLACTAVHEGLFNPEKARLQITHEYNENGIRITSKHCTLCGKCEEVCPEEAITNNGRWMAVDRDTCTGCALCVDICPTGVIYLDKDDISIICDLCGGKPKCIEWCPKDVISLCNTTG